MIRVRATKYDYYMYLGSDVIGATLGSPSAGLFFEDMESPYAD